MLLLGNHNLCKPQIPLLFAIKHFSFASAQNFCKQKAALRQADSADPEKGRDPDHISALPTKRCCLIQTIKRLCCVRCRGKDLSSCTFASSTNIPECYELLQRTPQWHREVT